MVSCGRTPSGVRGLKLSNKVHILHTPLSHPVRGAWIEIGRKTEPLKDQFRRTPSGVRGLKYKSNKTESGALESHPVRGAWIEIGVSNFE